MAQYIKKEMPDLRGTGSSGAYYRLKTWRKLEFDEFVKRCHNLHGAYGRSVIEGVVMAVCEHLAYELGNGYCVRINGLGTFNAKLGVRKDKDMDGFEEGTSKRNAKSIEVTGVSFRADKELIREIDRNCDLERGGEDRLHKSKFTEEERIEKAHQFLCQNGYMRVSDYVSLTGLSYTTASRELRRLASNPTTGIISQGRKSSKLYLLAPEP